MLDGILYHEDPVLRLRNIAFKLLPLLMVVWVTVAVLGGALYLAEQAGPRDAGDAAKTGLGLCAVAVLTRRAVRRASVPALVAWLQAELAARPPSRPTGIPLSGPPATGPPIFFLLRVSRT